MRRVVVPELLDNDLGTPKEINDSLADLRWLNHHFGGIETTADLLRRIAAKTHLNHISFLDVGGATGDVANAVRTVLKADGVELDIAVLDQSPSHLASENGHFAIAGNALRLPFADRSFDV